MHLNLITRLIACWLAISFQGLQIAPANADMIGTQTMVNQTAAKADRDRLKSILERETARKLLTSHGVTFEQGKMSNRLPELSLRR
jgi:hypothetical protein